MATKRDLFHVSASSTDSVGEWLRAKAFELAGLHPYEVLPDNGQPLPAPHEDEFGNTLRTHSPSSAYYLEHTTDITAGIPILTDGAFPGQEVLLVSRSAAFDVPAGACAGAPFTLQAGQSVRLTWDDVGRQWVAYGAPSAPPTPGPTQPVQRGAYASANSATFTGASLVPFDVEMLGGYDPNGALQFSPGIGYVALQSGVYEAGYSISIDNTNTSRTSSQASLFSTVGVTPGSVTYGYHRTVANGQDTLTLSLVRFEQQAGDFIAPIVQRISGTGVLFTVANACSMWVRRVADL